jgi:hypothetical protein
MTIIISEVIMASFAEMSPAEIAAIFEQERQQRTFEKSADANLAALRDQARQSPDLLSNAFRDFRQRGQPANPEEEKTREAALDLEYFQTALKNFENALDRARSEPFFVPDLAIRMLIDHLSRLTGEVRTKAIQEADVRYADSLYFEFWEQVKIGRGDYPLSTYETAKRNQKARLDSASRPNLPSQTGDSEPAQSVEPKVAAQPSTEKRDRTDGELRGVLVAELSDAIIDALT